MNLNILKLILVSKIEPLTQQMRQNENLEKWYKTNNLLMQKKFVYNFQK